MWTCPHCQRKFKTTNQSHSCLDTTIDDLFVKSPEHLILTFDALLLAVYDWEPNHIGAAKHSVVFTNKKAWLIVKPMRKELDVKFYLGTPLEDEQIHKVSPFSRNKYAHHIRLSTPEQVTPEVLRLLRLGFDFGMKS